MSVAAERATIGSRVQTLLGDIAQAPTVSRARERSEELARTLVDLYGSALERILEIVHETADERTGARIFDALCADRFVESLLVLHDLHPLSAEDRVRAALDAVRPYLESHAGGIEVIAVTDGVAHLRLEGTCDGCPSSAATVQLTVERAILERLPDIQSVSVQNVSAARSDTPAATLRLESDWIDFDAAAGSDTLTQVGIAGTPVLLLSHAGTVLAYRDRCPTCSRSFAASTYAYPLLHCAPCGSAFDVAHGGRADDPAGPAAEPFALVRDGTRVRVAIPVGA